MVVTVFVVVAVGFLVVVVFCDDAVVLRSREVMVVLVCLEVVDVSLAVLLVFPEVIALFVVAEVVIVEGESISADVTEVVVLGKVIVRLEEVVVISGAVEDTAVSDGVRNVFSALIDVVVSKRPIEVSTLSSVVVVLSLVGASNDNGVLNCSISKQEVSAATNTKTAARITCHRLL